jgi:hypothetical protein
VLCWHSLAISYGGWEVEKSVWTSVAGHFHGRAADFFALSGFLVMGTAFAAILSIADGGARQKAGSDARRVTLGPAPMEKSALGQGDRGTEAS